MRTLRVGTPCLGILALLLFGGIVPAAEKFPLEEGDTWVFGGDSITAQKQHTNYIEAFCYARYPKLTFRFRNSGVGGNKIPDLINRFEYDVAAWKPTIVSVELGMNDKGGTTVPQYVDQMGKLTGMIQGVKARPVFITASPVNNGNTTANLDAGNKRLDEYAVALKKFAAEQKAPFADQFHDLIDVWGRNTARLNLLNMARSVATDDSAAGVEHLRKFLEAQEKSGGKPVSLMGDPVHPGPTGQLMMAAAILKDLGAEGFVSQATVTLDGDKLMPPAVRGCTLDNVMVEKGVVSFDRTDECLPFPIPEEARPVVAFDPTILGLSAYILRVGDLKAEKYDIQIDGKMVGTVTAEELAKGVNLTRFAQGPVADQGKAILAAVAAKEGLVQQWRGQSQKAHAANAAPAEKEKLADMTKKVEEADAKIREAAKARKMRFEITPVKS